VGLLFYSNEFLHFFKCFFDKVHVKFARVCFCTHFAVSSLGFGVGIGIDLGLGVV
jgi:hypothetical protein